MLLVTKFPSEIYIFLVPGVRRMLEKEIAVTLPTAVGILTCHNIEDGIICGRAFLELYATL